MFDDDTRRVIAEGPPLDGLDLERLPEELSRAFASISAARVRLIGATHDARRNEQNEVHQEVARLRRLAQTYESLALLLPPGERITKSAAFVAATAHRYLYLSRKIWGKKEPLKLIDVSAHAVSSRVSAALLFFGAGYFPDGSEIMRERALASAPLGATVARSLRELIRGRCGAAILHAETEVSADSDREDESDLETLLERELFCALGDVIRDMALAQLDPSHQTDTIPATLDGIIADAVLRMPGLERKTVVAYAGIHHLALLLKFAWRTMREQRVVTLPSPRGVKDGQEWFRIVQRIASKRSLLWENHLEAVSKGFLDQGTSAAVAFPTGAGKSTLVQMKVAATLLSGCDVLIIAPTNALVDQYLLELKEVVDPLRVRRGLGRPEHGTSKTNAYVTTPESCLIALDEEPELFSNIGLLIFDECHILAGRDLIQDRRSLDSMRTLLRITHRCPSIDIVLISAMMSNANELKDWIRSITNKHSIKLDTVWKPTRQLKGCVVYHESDIAQSNRQIAVASRTRKTKGPPTALKKAIGGVPYVIFSHRYSWTTRDASDYSIQQLMNQRVPLGVGVAEEEGEKRSRWYLSANRNEVAGALAGKLVRSGLTTMVLSQDIGGLGSIAKRAAKALDSIKKARLNKHEVELLNKAAYELGGEDHVYSPHKDLVAFHHGLLLKQERELSESVFRRKAVRAIVVTPTLSQGINLPAEAIVIAGDDKFDRSTNQRLTLKPEDLLNAAGRAGRAASNATGIVIVVPGVPTSFGERNEQIHIDQRWFDLQEEVFSNPDQCVDISDPFDLLLDAVSADVGHTDSTLDALIRKHFSGENDLEVKEQLSKSLAAFAAKRKGALEAFQTKTDALMNRRATRLTAQQDAIIDAEDSIRAWLKQGHYTIRKFDNWTPVDWCNAIFDWIHDSPNSAQLLGADWLSNNRKKKGDKFIALTKSGVIAWMKGKPFLEIESIISPGRKSKKSLSARKLIIREVPLIASAVRTLARELSAVDKEVERMGRNAATCITQGFDTISKLALTTKNPKMSRREVHDLAEILGLPPLLGCDLSAAREAVNNALSPNRDE